MSNPTPGLLIGAALLAASGCTVSSEAPPPSPNCGVENATQACLCPPNLAGVQVCQGDGAWSACDCALSGDVPSSDADADDVAADAPPDITVDPGPDAPAGDLPTDQAVADDAPTGDDTTADGDATPNDATTDAVQPTGPTLTLHTLKATPAAEGAGAASEGFRGATSPKLGRVVNNNTDTTDATLVGTFNGVELWEGSVYGLWWLSDIAIVPRIGGLVDGEDASGAGGTGQDRTYLTGDNVTYFGMLGPVDNLRWNTSKIVWGCDPSMGNGGDRYCEGATNNTVLGMKSYLDDPPVGTPTTNNYGRNNAVGFNMNQSYFAYLSLAYGGDQILDFGGWEDTGDAPDNGRVNAKYVNGDLTVQYCIFGNGYGTGGIYGQNVDAIGPSNVLIPHHMNASMDTTKNLWINISHRFPNYRPAANQLDYFHKWNNYIYNPYGVRLTRANGTAKIWSVNNIVRPGAQTRPYEEDGLDQLGSYAGGFDDADIFAAGNIWEGQTSYSTDNDFWWRNFGGSGQVGAQHLDGADDEPANAYWLISTEFDIEALRTDVVSYAGYRWATDAQGQRASNVDALQQRFIDDATAFTNVSWEEGIKEDDTSNQQIPANVTGPLWPDSNNNLIADAFEAAHNLGGDPFAVTATWTFDDHGGYTVINDAGYTDIEMYAWWVQDIFHQLIVRGEVLTDPTYSIDAAP